MWEKHLLIISFFILGCSTPTVIRPQVTRTPLPTLTPTPVFYRWEAVKIIRAIRAAGLENENAHLMTAEEYGSIPALAVQGIRFSLPSICPDCGGLVLSFNDPAALTATETYYAEVTAENNPDLSSWVFVKDNILLQLSGQLSEAQAFRYGAILIRLD